MSGLSADLRAAAGEILGRSAPPLFVRANLPAASCDRMRDVFLTSSRYVLSFWEMGWTSEAWPQLNP